MDKLQRNDKLRLAEELVGSRGWEWVKSEYETMVRMKKHGINTQVSQIENHVFEDGVIAGIEWCMNFPEQSMVENQRFYDRLIEKIYQDKREVSE